MGPAVFNKFPGINDVSGMGLYFKNYWFSYCKAEKSEKAEIWNLSEALKVWLSSLTFPAPPFSHPKSRDHSS